MAAVRSRSLVNIKFHVPLKGIEFNSSKSDNTNNRHPVCREKRKVLASDLFSWFWAVVFEQTNPHEHKLHQFLLNTINFYDPLKLEIRNRKQIYGPFRNLVINVTVTKEPILTIDNCVSTA